LFIVEDGKTWLHRRSPCPFAGSKMGWMGEIGDMGEIGWMGEIGR
jgi:hypothetical protein